MTVCPQQDDYTGKWCDFTDGIWKCEDGLTPAGVAGVTTNPTSAQQCTAPVVTATNTFNKCIQCNSMTDTACWTKTTATDCDTSDATLPNCFSATSVIYDKHTGAVLRENIVRGCSDSSVIAQTTAEDQCYWSSSATTIATVAKFADEKQNLLSTYDMTGPELLCTTNCVGSGCNTEIPNGSISATQNVIYCATYDSTTESGAVKQDSDFSSHMAACPSGTEKCWSSVTYLERAQNKMNTNPYDNRYKTRIIEQKRGCGENAITEDKCTEDTSYVSSTSTKVNGAPVTKHTCVSTCEGGNCNNNGWPTRPRCLQSSGAALTGANVVTTCPSPSDDMCYIQEHNFVTPSSHYYRSEQIDSYSTDGKDLGFTTTVIRGCSKKADGYFTTGCNKHGKRGVREYENQFFESCNYTCSEDGCNWGSSYSGSFMTVASPVIILVAALFKNL